MSRRVIVRRGTYHDSARLMRIARELSAVPGIASADVMMGTAANAELLASAGFPREALGGATPMDMVVALVGDEAAFAAADDRLEALLAPGVTSVGRGLSASSAGQGLSPSSVGQGFPGLSNVEGSLAEAIQLRPSANLVSIAVPGPYAAFVANRALDAGRNVFLFSDNVPVEQEVALKTRARAAGLLLMGPDCGTAIIAGTGLGFANRVPRGPVGIVGASGTGIQEVSCLLSRLGTGVSHAIGTGSRDLSDAVGGIMSEFALRLLADDETTGVVVLVAKHPAPAVARRLHAVLAGLGKPAVVRYLGEPARAAADGVVYADTLDEAAKTAAAEALGSCFDTLSTNGTGEVRPELVEGRTRPGRLVGLFGGGSLAAEARHVLSGHGVSAATPTRPLVPGEPIPGTEHLIVDAGDDAYTVGRPHPMVDQTGRCGLIRTAAADPHVGVLLLDLVLGDGAHADPAPEVAAAVTEGRLARGGAPLAVVCSVCGSADDPQDVGRQVAALEAAGVHTEPTAARAAHAAAAMIEGAGR